MLYYQRKCETKITILMNFYRELNFYFKVFSKFFTKNRNILENFSKYFYFQNFWKVSNVLFIFIEQIISFQSFSLFFIENLVNLKVFTCIYAVLFTFVHNGASYEQTREKQPVMTRIYDRERPMSCAGLSVREVH